MDEYLVVEKSPQNDRLKNFIGFDNETHCKKYERFLDMSFSVPAHDLKDYETRLNVDGNEDSQQIDLCVSLIKIILLSDDCSSNEVLCILSNISRDLLMSAKKRMFNFSLISKKRSHSGKEFLGKRMGFTEKFSNFLLRNSKSDIYTSGSEAFATLTRDIGVGSYLLNEERAENAGMMSVIFNALSMGMISVNEIYQNGSDGKKLDLYFI
jgi:hypothetical protein